MEKMAAFIDTLGCCWCVRRQPSILGINTKIPVWCVVGPPGAGKTTLAKALAKGSEFHLINIYNKGTLHGSTTENLGMTDDSFDEEIVLHLKAAIDKNKLHVPGFILDGFPKNLYQFKLFKAEVYEPRMIIYVTLTEKEYVARIHKLPHHPKEEIEIIAIYNKETALLNEIYRKYDTKTLKVLSNVSVNILADRLLDYMEVYFGFKFPRNKTNVKEYG